MGRGYQSIHSGELKSLVALFFAFCFSSLTACGGGGGGSGSANGNSGNPDPVSQEVVLLDEGQVRSSGELVLFRLQGDGVAPEDPIEGLVDGNIPIQIVPVDDSTLAVFLPELTDGTHSLSFRFGETRRIFSLDTVTEALPEDFQAFAKDYFDQVEAAFGALSPNNPDLVTAADRDAFSAAITDARNTFAQLDQSDQQQIVRLIQVVLAPLLNELNAASSRAAFSTRNASCGDNVLDITRGIAKFVGAVYVASAGTLVSAVPAVGSLVTLASYAGAIGIMVVAYDDIDKGFDNFGPNCIPDPVLTLVENALVFDRSAETDSLGNLSPRAAVSGLEFESGADRRLSFSAEGDYPEEIIAALTRLRSSVGRFVDNVTPFLPDRLAGQLSRVADLVNELPTEETFEPDMSGYQLAEISNGSILASVSGGTGFLDLRFTAESPEIVPETGLRFTVQLTDQATGRELLPDISLDALLLEAPPEPPVTYFTEYRFYRNGIQRGTFDMPDSFTNVTISRQPDLAGTVMMEDNRKFIFTAANDFVGDDVFEITADSNGSPIRGNITLTVTDNCQIIENEGDILRQENCVFDEEPGLRLERTRTESVDSSVSPVAYYLGLTETEITMVNYTTEGGYVADRRRVSTNSAQVLESGGNAESIELRKEVIERPIGSDGLPVLGQSETRSGSIASGVSLRLSTLVDLGSFSSEVYFCSESPSSNVLERKTTTNTGSETVVTTELNEQGLTFSEFCGTRNDVDSINDLVPSSF